MLLLPGAKWLQNVAVYPNRAHEQGMKRRFKEDSKEIDTKSLKWESFFFQSVRLQFSTFIYGLSPFWTPQTKISAMNMQTYYFSQIPLFSSQIYLHLAVCTCALIICCIWCTCFAYSKLSDLGQGDCDCAWIRDWLNCTCTRSRATATTTTLLGPVFPVRLRPLVSLHHLRLPPSY